MIELFEEDYTLVKKGVSIGTDVTSASSSTEGYTDGNLYINSDTLDIWLTDGQSWQLVGHIQGISNVTTQESLDDDGINTVTIIMTDGTSKTLNVKNGKTGAKGDTGVSIVGVVDNGDGSFYLTKSDGTKTDDIQTIQGDKGDTGDVGPRGYTGEKGRDVTAITMTGTGKSHPIYATYSDTTTQLIGVINDGNDGSGAGDMLKATYDVNDDGIVDKAETLTNGVETITVTSIKNKADKSTSLAGYGIDDAYTKTEVDEMFDGVASDWDSVTSKPFSTVGTDFKTSGDKLALSENVTEKLAHIDEIDEDVNYAYENGFIAKNLNAQRVDGYSIAEDGTITPNSSFAYMDYVDVSSLNTVVIEGVNGDDEQRNTRVFGYDSSKSVVSQIILVGVVSNGELDLTLDVSQYAYIRISAHKKQSLDVTSAKSNVELTEELSTKYGTADIQFVRVTKTTGATYAECSINFTDKGKKPIVVANAENNNMVLTINTLTNSSCQFILRNGVGALLNSTSVTIMAMIAWI